MSEDNDVYNEFMQDRDNEVEAVQPAKPKKPRSRGKDLAKLKKIAPKGKVVKKAAAKKQPAKKPQAGGKVLAFGKVGFTSKVSASSIAKQSKKTNIQQQPKQKFNKFGKKSYSKFAKKEKSPDEIVGDSWKIFQPRYGVTLHLCYDCVGALYGDDEKFEYLGDEQYLAKIGMCPECAVGNISLSGSYYTNFGKKNKSNDD